MLWSELPTKRQIQKPKQGRRPRLRLRPKVQCGSTVGFPAAAFWFPLATEMVLQFDPAEALKSVVRVSFKGGPPAMPSCRCRSEWNNWFVLISSNLHLQEIQDWDLQKETSKFKDYLARFYLACIGPLMCSMDHHGSGFTIKGQRLLHPRGKLRGSNTNSICGYFFVFMFCWCVMCIWDSELKKYLCTSVSISPTMTSPHAGPDQGPAHNWNQDPERWWWGHGFFYGISAKYISLAFPNFSPLNHFPLSCFILLPFLGRSWIGCICKWLC